MNKKGIIGSIAVLFFVTITIIIILSLFALASTLIKTLGGTSGNIKVYEVSESDLKEISVSSYFSEGDRYLKLVKFRLFLVRGYTFDESLVRARTGGS
tara:strand:+ start:122 stop:415 length:294 start_codon:yes stop_codon:yes gene_type:complete